MANIFVIAGHGAGDSGATGNGYTEAERVRALADRIKALGGSSVTLGDKNRNYYADNGISKLNISKSTQIIELHLDSAAASAKGGHVIIKSGYSPDKYDNALAKNISKLFPGRSNTIVKRSDLANVNRAATKGYGYRLLECCFISNKDDITRFSKDLDAVATAILSAFDIKTATEDKPKQVPGAAKNDKGLYYAMHVQTLGNLAAVHDGQTAGTVGYSKRGEALKFTKLPSGVSLRIRTHVQKKGWSSWQDVKLNTYYGTTGESLRLEAIQLKAYKDGKEIDINYQAHCQTKGWMTAVKNGATAGTTGLSKRLEAIKILL